MLHSPNLNVIVKSLEKISAKVARDFTELENLQSNNFSAAKFTNSCFERVEENLVQEFEKNRPDYSLRTIFGKQIRNNVNSEYQYVICAVDGLMNLSRSLTSFTSFVALEHINGGKKQTISLAILNVAANEIYRCEKGSGSFLNNRRIRVSRRELEDGIVCSLSSPDLINHQLVQNLKNNKAVFQTNNCSSLELAHLACGKIDLCVFKKEDRELLDSILIIAEEAGAKIEEKEGLIFVKNEKLKI